MELEEGTYTLVFSFVGYATKEISDVVIKNGEVFTLDVLMETNSLDTVVITTTTKRNTESAVLNLQKKSAPDTRFFGEALRSAIMEEYEALRPRSVDYVFI